MVKRILPFLLAFIVTVAVMSAYSFILTERSDRADQLTVYAPGHAAEVRTALLEARIPNIRKVDDPGEHMTFGVTAIYTAIYLAALLLVFGGSLAVVKRLIRGTPTI
jgi:hypothetical protein